MLDSDMLVNYGGAIKALEGEEGLVGGYVVLFGDPESADTQGHYFTKATDFGLDLSDRGRVLFHHGLDKKIGTKSLAIASIKADDVGIWAQGILARRDKYEQAVYEMVKAGKLGWSSGTASHLVRINPSIKGAREITEWPLGLDLSLTPCPVDPRTAATIVSMKALTVFDGLVPVKAEPTPEDAGLKALTESVKGLLVDFTKLEASMKAQHIGKDAEKNAAMSAMSTLHYHAQDAIAGHMRDDKKSPDEKLSAIKSCMDEHRDLSLKAAKAMLSMPKGKDQSDAMKAILDSAREASCSGLRLNAHGLMVRDSIKAYSERLSRIAVKREAKGGSISAGSRAAVKAMLDDLEAVLVATEPKDRKARIKALVLEHMNDEAAFDDLLGTFTV